MTEVNNICDDPDLMFLIVSGLRYCMGRNTYAPLIAQEVIHNYWSQIDEYHKDILRKDVEEYVDRMRRASAGPFAFADTNKDLWISLHDWMKEN